MKLIKFILLLTVFLIPLTGSINNLGYEQIKVFLFVFLITICGLLWLIYSFKHPINIGWSDINKAAVLFILLLFFTSILGADRWASFLGNYPYFQGWVLYAYLYLFFLLVVWTKISFKTWTAVLVASSTLVGLLAIKDWMLLNFFHIQVPNYAGRVVSTFGQPNFYAGFALLSLPFTYYLLSRTLGRVKIYLISFVLLIELFAIVISESRTAWMLLIFFGFVWLMSKVKAWFSITFITIIIIVISTGLSGHFSSGILSGELLNLKLSDNPDLTQNSVEKRPYIWVVAAEIVKQSPIIGYGLENINKAYSNYFEKNKHKIFEENLKVSPVLISLKDLNIDRSHNYVLDLLLFSGIFGAIFWFLLVFLILRRILRSKITAENSILLVGLITYLIWIQFQNQSIVHLMYLWLITGLIEQNLSDY